MKVKELITALQNRHPEAEVNIYFNFWGKPSSTPFEEGHEYCLFMITDVGDWGNPGESDDLVTINGGILMGY